ncbi:hypothetical protein C7410_10844 [Paraburkholderia silvatlantica]|uniref:Uncharacterized protein n=1 Tax=Paraburkholderia silvatlantica TaxID=321895 RepID=A0A2V4UFN2_9BURK|nr:hypothetical protein [Paraburkholderia silvatlantica]PYE23147.1 hypothetical protein C7410_10844 [Paraburkholderia silvatlantica]
MILERAKELREQLRVTLSPDNYRGPERSVVTLLCNANRDLQRVFGMIPENELLQFLSIFSGEGYSQALDEIQEHIPIHGSTRRNIKISDDYVPDFIQGRLQSIAIDDSNDPNGELRKKVKREPLTKVELSHWQVRRGMCYYIAAVNLLGAQDDIKKGEFHRALTHIASALKQIGAASVRSIDEIEKAAIEKGKIAISKQGAQARARKLEPVREYAVSLAQEKSYPSRRQAVLAIKDRVLERAKGLDGVSMSADQAEKTIDGWLKKSGYTPSASKQGTSAS